MAETTRADGAMFHFVFLCFKPMFLTKAEVSVRNSFTLEVFAVFSNLFLPKRVENLNFI